MSVDACCCIDDYDPPAFYHDEIRTARKAHVCVECGETVNPGDKYEHVVGKWEGDFNTYKTCEFCLKIRRDFFTCGWIFGGMVENFYDCHGWDYRELPEDEDE